MSMNIMINNGTLMRVRAIGQLMRTKGKGRNHQYVPLRTRMLLSDAERLEKGGFYTSAILLYSHYVEQRLLIHHLNQVEKTNPAGAEPLLDHIMKTKDEGHLTFGRILEIVKPSITNRRTVMLCNEVKKVRDTLAAHFFFVTLIDKGNRKKRGFHDVSRYRRLIKRMYALVEERGRIYEVEYFLKAESPLVRMSRIETDELDVERLLLQRICSRVRDLTALIESQLLAMPHKQLDDFTLPV